MPKETPNLGVATVPEPIDEGWVLLFDFGCDAKPKMEAFAAGALLKIFVAGFVVSSAFFSPNIDEVGAADLELAGAPKIDAAGGVGVRGLRPRTDPVLSWLPFLDFSTGLLLDVPVDETCFSPWSILLDFVSADEVPLPFGALNNGFELRLNRSRVGFELLDNILE